MSDYKTNETLYEGENTVIYRGKRIKDDFPVIIKVFKSEHPPESEIEKLRYEYNIAKSLDNLSGTVTAYEFTKYNNIPALILEDFGGISLNALIEKNGMGIDKFLYCSMLLTKTLGEIHLHNIIHKDIKPQNIIINLEKDIVKITDFGISVNFTEASQEQETPENDDDTTSLEGTLVYMSPEQTGRMNRTIDFRSDLYSLGITFYEMITGKIPFDTEDPLELVHYHIAVKPTPPKDIRPDIPQTVSDIIMKLLEKNPDNRYQSIYGLLKDLEKCSEMLNEQGRVSEFEIGKKDISSKLKLSSKVYGRKEEVNKISELFENVYNGKLQIITITGNAGIGKTALIEEASKSTRSTKGFFVTGDFDKESQSVPYSAIINVFDKLINRLLMQSQSKIADFSYEIKKALGKNAQVIIDIIPSLEKIIGKQPPAIPLEGKEAQNRLTMLFQDFVKVFTYPKHPLTIFLDNVEWIDPASLELIDILMTNTEGGYFLLILAYRPQEIEENNKDFNLKLEKIRKVGTPIEVIELKPLDFDNVKQLIKDSLFIDTNEPPSLTELTKLIMSKTNSNPFFIRSFLTTIYEEGLLRLNRDEGLWAWDLDKIKGLSFSDNVVDLTMRKLQKLEESTSNMLALASCIGDEFERKLLAQISETSEKEVDIKLRQSVDEGLITLKENKENIDKNVKYRFIHTRVKEGASALLSETTKGKIHLKLGRMMSNKLNKKEREEKIFEIVGHINYNIDMINLEKEQYNASKLNLIAGRKARASVAYEQALYYITKSMDIMKDLDMWNNYYKFAYLIHKERAEYEMLCSNLENSEKYLVISIDNAKTDIEKSELYQKLINLKLKINDPSEGVKLGKKALKLLDIDIPDDKKALNTLIEQEQEELTKSLKDNDLSTILDLPMMKSQKHIMSIKILMNMNVLSSYLHNVELGELSISKVINMLLKHGRVDKTPFCAAVYAINLIRKNKISDAYKWGLLATKLADKSSDPASISATYNIFASYIIPSQGKIKRAFPYYTKAYKTAIESGNWSSAGAILTNSSIMKFTVGEPLKPTLEYIEDGLSFLRRTRNHNLEQFLTILKVAILNLQGKTKDNSSYSYDDFDEDEFLEKIKKSKFQMGIDWYFYFKIKTLFLYEEFEKLIEILESEDSLRNRKDNAFYYAIAQMNLFDTYSDEKKNEALEFMELTIKNFEEDIAQKTEVKEDSGYYILKARYEQHKHNDLKGAMKYFEKAIKLAVDENNAMDSATYYDEIARFYLSYGFDFIAKAYLNEAIYAYKTWGAIGRVKDIKEKHPHLISSDSVREDTSKELNLNRTITGEASSETLDLATIMKASQAISGEIILNKLLKILMNIVIENAGAEKGFLLLSEGDNWFIEAEGDVKRKNIIVLQSIPVEGKLPLSIVNYVQRTKENIVLIDAVNSEMFSTDPYISANQPKSIICSPLINQGKLAGILYLENNLITGAFTKQKLKVLKLLSTQIAISIDNAKLYEQLEDYSKNLEKKVEERTYELNEANKELNVTNNELSKKNKIMERELEMAKRVQEGIIPTEEEFPKRNELKMAAHYSAMESVGGDLYDIIRIGRNSYGFLMADVSGHGVPSALITTMAKVSFTSNSGYGIASGDIFKAVNTEMFNFIGDLEYYLTAYYCIIDLETGVLQYSNAGHHPAVLYRAETKSIEQLDTSGFLVGAFDGVDYESKSIELKNGDRILLFTDGIIEARNRNGEFYEYERFMDYVNKNSHLSPKEFITNLVADVETFCDGEPPDDDRTILYFEFVSNNNDL